MIEFLEQYNLVGVTIGISSFLIIGLFHPIVIKCEYYFGCKCWWWFVLIGIAGLAVAIMVNNIFYSSILSIFAFSSLWSIIEIFEQRTRVEKGWFPMNPKRKAEYSVAKKYKFSK